MSMKTILITAGIALAAVAVANKVDAIKKLVYG